MEKRRPPSEAWTPTKGISLFVYLKGKGSVMCGMNLVIHIGYIKCHWVCQLTRFPISLEFQILDMYNGHFDLVMYIGYIKYHWVYQVVSSMYQSCFPICTFLALTHFFHSECHSTKVENEYQLLIVHVTCLSYTGLPFSKASRVRKIPRSSVTGDPWWNASGHDC